MHTSAQQAGTAFPWYDGYWLRKYVAAKAWFAAHRPDSLAEFLEATHILQTRPDFRPQRIDHLFDDAVLADIVTRISAFTMADFEFDETATFGRYVVRNNPWFTELQQSYTTRVSDIVGEPLEPRYNFISLYTRLGVCPVHLDAPEAKWTLDVCLEQSAPWPIHFSQVVPWPENLIVPADDWDRAIKVLPDLRFESVTLEPNEAVVFSGSSQWHYRDPQPRQGTAPFCHLLFFHFIPKGAGRIVDYQEWPDLFGAPELRAVLDAVT